MSLAVFGPGLLGGSLLLDARARGVRELRVWGRREASLQQVRDRGLADLASTDAQLVAVAQSVEVVPDQVYCL